MSSFKIYPWAYKTWRILLFKIVKCYWLRYVLSKFFWGQKERKKGKVYGVWEYGIWESCVLSNLLTTQNTLAVEIINHGPVFDTKWNWLISTISFWLISSLFQAGIQALEACQWADGKCPAWWSPGSSGRDSQWARERNKHCGFGTSGG